MSIPKGATHVRTSDYGTYYVKIVKLVVYIWDDIGPKPYWDRVDSLTQADIANDNGFERIQ